jgi:hypothetical protein
MNAKRRRWPEIRMHDRSRRLGKRVGRQNSRDGVARATKDAWRVGAAPTVALREKSRMMTLRIVMKSNR